MISSTLGSRRLYLCFKLCMYHHPCYMLRPSHRPLFDYPKNITKRFRIMCCCTCVSQHPVACSDI
jgi:hypothetical protein